MLPEEYLILFSAITDALAKLEQIKQDLIVAQQAAEEAYISRE